MTTESSVDSASKLLDCLRAMFAPDMSTSAIGIVNGTFKIGYNCGRPADSNVYLAAANILAAPNTIAGNVTSTHTLCANTQVQQTFESFHITTNAAISQAATNLATIQLVYNNGNGGTDTVIAGGNTAVAGGVANTTANVPSAISITAANATVAAGSCIQIKVTKSGAAGKELPFVHFSAIARLGV